MSSSAVSATTTDPIAAVRSFNRFYTNVIGLLREGLLRTPYTLTEARVIFELAQREAAEVIEIRRLLDIDAGYLTRILAGFEADGLVTRRRSTEDGRRQVARLTRKGRAAFRTLDERSTKEIEGLLALVGKAELRRLIGAMCAIQRILGDGQPETAVLREPEPGDYGWVIQRHGALYAEEYGWDVSFEALVARIVADYLERRDPARDVAWMAELDGELVGCVFCTKSEEKVAQLRLLLVEPDARGMGVGTRLVEECVRFARRAGYESITLWTNDVLQDARRIYERAGFRLTDETHHHSFGHDLVGQNWRLEL